MSFSHNSFGDGYGIPGAAFNHAPQSGGAITGPGTFAPMPIPNLNPYALGSEPALLDYLASEVEQDNDYNTLLDETWDIMEGYQDPYVTPVLVYGDVMYLPTTLVQKMIARAPHNSGRQGAQQDAGWIFPWL